MNILSIQSHVAYGHVGNSAAVFPMQRLGHEVWPVNTVQFSNHPGYGAWKGTVFDAALIEDCVAGIAERGMLTRCDGLLSGYLGSVETGQAILEAAEAVKNANPQALWCCDPVMGDIGPGLFVRPGIPEFFSREALPKADIITPNQFELELLAGFATPQLDDARRALDILHGQGPHIILVTSLHCSDTPQDQLDLMASGPDGLWRVRTPRLNVAAHGAGDTIAALFFVHYLATRSCAKALSLAASSVYGLLKCTAQAGSSELLTIPAQEEFVAPSQVFAATRIG